MSSTDRTFALLELLALKPGGVSFGELRVLDLTAPTLSRLLKALIARKMVEKTDNGRYQLGEGARILARLILGQISREDRVKPLLDILSEQTGESAAYYERTTGGIRLLAKKEAPQSFHYISVGEENFQNRHAFLLAMNADSQNVIHETWETAAGFDRLAVGFSIPDIRGGRERGALGITFARGRYKDTGLTGFSKLLKELCHHLED